MPGLDEDECRPTVLATRGFGMNQRVRAGLSPNCNFRGEGLRGYDVTNPTAQPSASPPEGIVFSRGTPPTHGRSPGPVDPLEDMP